MHRPDDEFINQFREKFGDLLLSCNGERGITSACVDVGDPGLSSNYVNGNEFTGAIWENEASSGRTLRLESGFITYHNFHASDSFSPMISAKKHKRFDDQNLLGSGAVFHNQAGDLHSPMVRWNSNISPLFDESTQGGLQISWNGPNCFTPLAESQRWLCDNPYFGQADDISRTLMHHDSGYTTVNDADQDTLTDGFSEQLDSKFDLVTSEARFNKQVPCSSRENFRYDVTLRAPTSIHCHTNESPVTYLNKGQTYSLIVADSTPPTSKVGLCEYRTVVHVSFEGEDQRSNPVQSWQLWKEGRGLKEARERKGKVLAVEYVNPSQGDVRDPGHHRIQLEKAFIDGFCVTWTADSSANVCEVAIPLKFNFLSTDFSRSKGVKGVPVRLCAKTKILRSVDDMKTLADEPEMCYCVVKLFRDHGAERKSLNDKAYVTKRIEKLKNQINNETGVHFDRLSRNDNSTNGGQLGIRHPRKRKRSVSSHKSLKSDRDLHDQLAAMTKILASTRPVSKLRLRGSEKDDPELCTICFSSTSLEAGVLNNQYSIHAINSTFDGAAQLSKKANLQSDLHSPDCQDCLPKTPKVPSRTSQGCSLSPANHSSKSVACFYVQFTQNGKKPQGNHYAIYLTARTSLNLKTKLAEKLRIDQHLVSRIVWVSEKGLKVVVDDDMVQHIPEAQSMVADICQLPYTEMAPSSAKGSEVEVKLVF